MRVRNANVWILSSLLLVAGGAGAQQASAPTATGETGLFTLIDGWTVPDGQWSLGFYYNNWDRIVAGIPGGAVAPNSDNWDYDWNRLSASAGYGVTDRFELSIMAPYEDFSASDNRRQGYLNGHRFDNHITADGIGNVRLGAKYQLFGDVETGEAVSVNVFVEAPTGDGEGVTTDDTGFGVGLNWNFSPRWMARLGYRDPGDPDGNFDVSEEVEAGVGYAAPLTDRFDWITEINATLYQSGTTDPDDAIDIATGGRLWLGEDRRWAFNFALRTEYNQLGDTEEHCPIGGLIGLTLMPQRAVAIAEVVPPPPAPPPPPPAPEPTPAPAPEPTPVAPPPPPRPTESREEINFDSDSARLTNIAKAKLDEVALRLKQNPAATVLIIGGTDSQNADAYNESLGLRRAESAKKYLITRHQIDEARITAETRGESDPQASNDTAEGRAENRRAVIIIRL